jgi:hypothetical protein
MIEVYSRFPIKRKASTNLPPPILIGRQNFFPSLVTFSGHFFQHFIEFFPYRWKEVDISYIWSTVDALIFFFSCGQCRPFLVYLHFNVLSVLFFYLFFCPCKPQWLSYRAKKLNKRTIFITSDKA